MSSSWESSPSLFSGEVSPSEEASSSWELSSSDLSLFPRPALWKVSTECIEESKYVNVYIYICINKHVHTHTYEACTGVVLSVGGHGVWGSGEWGVYV